MPKPKPPAEAEIPDADPVGETTTKSSTDPVAPAPFETTDKNPETEVSDGPIASHVTAQTTIHNPF